MKQIFSEILRSEENAGFTPGEPDDDTFLLATQQNYPGTVPSFDDENENSETTELIQEESLPSQEEILAPPAKGSIWDIFEQEQTSDQIVSENIENDNIEEAFSTAYTESQNQTQEIEEQQPESEYLFGDEVEIASEKPQEYKQLFTAAEHLETESENTESISSLELDSAFIKELEKEIKKSKEKKETIENFEEEYQEETNNMSFDDENNPSLFLILSDINTDSPSNIPDTGVPPINFNNTSRTIINESLSEPLNEIDNKSKKSKEQQTTKKDKHIRKISFFSLLKYPAVFLLFAVSGIALYYIWDNFGYQRINLISSKLFSDHSEKQIPKQVKDTKPVEAQKTPEMAKAKEQIKHEIQEPDKTENNEQTVPKNIDSQITQKETKLTQKPDKPEETKLNMASNVRSEEAKTLLVKRNISPVAKKNVTNANDIALNNNKVAKEEIYTIQVYATPSLEDAKNWIREIKMRHNIDAYISPQIVRDRQWYRVRFGYFSSMEEATATALKFGFSQSWIDRIQ